MSVNIIYNDLATKTTFARALAWYKYYHWRVALSLNWVEKVGWKCLKNFQVGSVAVFSQN